MPWNKGYATIINQEYVQLSDLPSQANEYQLSFDTLAGGLNIHELDYRLKPNESPEMRNLVWRDGVLCSRFGQVWLNDTKLGKGYATLAEPWHDTLFAHIGKKLYAFNKSTGAATQLIENVPEVRGTFFTFDAKLYYKTVGAYLVIDYNNGSFNCSPVVGYTPITYINCSYENGAGDAYQPENRLQDHKTLWYNAAEDVTEYHLPVVGKDLVTVSVDDVELTKEQLTLTNTGECTYEVNEATWRTQSLPSGTYEFEHWASPRVENPTWKLNGNEVDLNDYGITVTGTPEDGDTVTASYTQGEYYYDKDLGIVHFITAPPVTVPATNNTVHITYNAPNVTAKANIMNCRYVSVFGGSTELCVVMAGDTLQKNAYYWTGQDSYSMNPTYFPMTQYQLAGDASYAITGFGKQQSYLVVFKENSVGRSTLSTETVEDRTTISLAYVPINAKIGCDLPWTIQLIENNLVWCNTAQGVHLLKDSSSAYENNIECVSNNVNGSDSANGVLYNIRIVDPDDVCSMDDERRYTVCANGKAWLWDYNISSYKQPSWFFQTGVKAVDYISEREDMWHLNGEGQMTHFENVFMDYGEGIDKSYKFAVQNFGSYDRLKNVNSVLINIRGDTDSVTEVEYITDYETRKDLTDLKTFAWHLVPRNLEYRDLSGSGFCVTFRRKPFCRHVRHFSMRLSNNVAGQNLSIVSAQVFYNYQGRERAKQ